MLFNKNAIKIGFSVLGLSLFFSSPASALWPFSHSTVEKSVNSVGSKEIFENSKEKLESTKNNYEELISKISDAAFQLETGLSDLKNSRVSFQEQLGKLAAAYKEWAQNNYTFSEDVYEKFNAEKEQFDKIACIVRIKEDILKTFFDNLSDLIQQDFNMYLNYKNSMSESVDAYYKYGLAVAKDVAFTI